MIIDNKLFIGTIKRYYDRDNSIIVFEIPHVIDEGKAYSLFKEKIPNIGEEVLLFKMDSTTDSMWYYLSICQNTQFTLEYDGNNVIIKDDIIYIQSDGGTVVSNQKHKDGSVLSSETESSVYGDNLVLLLKKLIEILMQFQTLKGDTISPTTGIALGDIYSQITKILYKGLRLDAHERIKIN